jgi:hypothetical protein
MTKEKNMNSTSSPVLARGVLLAFLAATLAAGQTAPPQKGFETPQLAADALVTAAGANDTAALLELFGPDGKDLVSTGDPVRDKAYVTAFSADARQKMAVAVDPHDASRATLSVGARNWPLPVPIVKKTGKWYFDAKAGREEILARRIGANELDAIQICRRYDEAQWEYASSAHDSSGLPQFAQKLISSPGKQDGLYWRNEDGSGGGPISEGVAKAIEEGYSPEAKSGFHGYYFKVLKGQGKSARMGELDYVIDGIMIGGFALAAAPVEYGVTGLKTFIVGPDGIVYEKDLGPKTLSIFQSMDRYDPDKTWHRTDDEWPTDAGH